VPDCTLGFLNEPYRAAGSTEKALPETPFPWIAWNNRPYVSAGELLQVPKLSTAELPRAFAFNNGTRIEKYDGDPNQIDPDDYEIDGPFSHLMNFFRTKSGPLATSGSPTYDPSKYPPVVGLYRVLDYVGVPSRYVGTETWLSPASFGSGGDPTSVDDARYLRQPPFNKISNYREPGRVNINTLGGDGKGAVWHGMFHDKPKYGGDPNAPEAHAAIDDDGLVSVRRGYGTFGNPTGTFSGEPSFLNADYPTLLGNPFRAPGAGNLVPIAKMLRADVDGTILRSMGRPPFDNASIVSENDPNGVPLLSAGTQDDYNNTNRNPYFRYQPLTRLGSMATTHSNVYAVWVTIGFFEVEEAPDRGTFADRNSLPLGDPATDALYNRVYPEGYELSREMGSDTGDFQRLRGFAIVDRSIPVAFEPGENHNVERAVRLRRRIE
jgi:hypothetical protein